MTDSHADRGDVIAYDFGDAYDPFLRLDDTGLDQRRRKSRAAAQEHGLLLAEEFARIDVSRPRRLRSWTLIRGAANRTEFYGDEPPEDEPLFPTADDEGSRDATEAIRAEQRDVRRSLDWLAALSTSRPGADGAWDSANGTWQSAVDNIGDHLRWRAERAVRSAVRLVPVETESGEEAVYRFRSAGPRVSYREKREWTSVLAPIALQLFESWRRISEGKPGAALCRECGEAFLILDGRRSAFCTNRERNRHNQRTRRIALT